MIPISSSAAMVAEDLPPANSCDSDAISLKEQENRSESREVMNFLGKKD